MKENSENVNLHEKYSTMDIPPLINFWQSFTRTSEVIIFSYLLMEEIEQGQPSI